MNWPWTKKPTPKAALPTEPQWKIDRRKRDLRAAAGLRASLDRRRTKERNRAAMAALLVHSCIQHEKAGNREAAVGAGIAFLDLRRNSKLTREGSKVLVGRAAVR